MSLHFTTVCCMFLSPLLLSYDTPERSFCSRSVIVVSCPCDAYGSLSVMMISSFCLDSLLLAVAPYCCISPLFMCLLRKECLSFFMHPFVYISVPPYLVIIIILLIKFIKCINWMIAKNQIKFIIIHLTDLERNAFILCYTI